jgi:hypothetical protein
LPEGVAPPPAPLLPLAAVFLLPLFCALAVLAILAFFPLLPLATVEKGETIPLDFQTSGGVENNSILSSEFQKIAKVPSSASKVQEE